MITFLKNRRFGHAVAWFALASMALICGSGCKHVATWTNGQPTNASPTPDPYGYPPVSDGYLHQPDPAPSLTPVPGLLQPGLPQPGHSVPVELPPPPAPAPDAAEVDSPAAESLSSRLKPKWNLKMTGFFSKKDSRPDSAPSATEMAAKTRSATEIRTSKPIPLPLAKLEVAQIKSNGNDVKPSLSRAVPTSQSLPFDDGYTGPVITPGSQYTTGRDVPIEPWSAAQRPTLQLRKQPANLPADDFAPNASPQTTTAQPAVQGSPASVPLLLPPGP